MDVKVEVLLQLFKKNGLKNGTKTFLLYSQTFSLFTVKFKKLGFSAPLILISMLEPNSLPVMVSSLTSKQSSSCIEVV